MKNVQFTEERRREQRGGEALVRVIYCSTVITHTDTHTDTDKGLEMQPLHLHQTRHGDPISFHSFTSAPPETTMPWDSSKQTQWPGPETPGPERGSSSPVNEN